MLFVSIICICVVIKLSYIERRSCYATNYEFISTKLNHTLIQCMYAESQTLYSTTSASLWLKIHSWSLWLYRSSTTSASHGWPPYSKSISLFYKWLNNPFLRFGIYILVQIKKLTLIWFLGNLFNFIFLPITDYTKVVYKF